MQFCSDITAMSLRLEKNDTQMYIAMICIGGGFERLAVHWRCRYAQMFFVLFATWVINLLTGHPNPTPLRFDKTRWPDAAARPTTIY